MKSGKSGNTKKSKNTKKSGKSGNTGRSGNIGKSENTFDISHLVDFWSCSKSNSWVF